MIDTPLIESIVAGTFSLDFQEAVLTPLAGESPEQRKGTATITLSVDGELELKVLLTHTLDVVRALNSFLQGTSGKLLEERAFYRLEAVSYERQLWTCERLIAADNISVAAASGTMTARPRRIQMRFVPEAALTGYHLYLALIGDVPLPYFSTEINGEACFEFTLNSDIAIRLSPHDGYVMLHAHSQSQSVSAETLDKVIEGLSIATGRELRWFYRHREESSVIETIIASCPKYEKGRKMWTAINERDPRPVVDFVCCYVELCAKLPNTYFGYWQKSFHAWQAGIAIAALPLAVYVEGIVKEFFPELMKETEEVIAAAERMAEHLADMDVPPNLLKRGVGALHGIKGKSPTSAMTKLAGEGWFDASLIKKWRTVRNKSAHGTDFTPTPDAEKQQETLDGVLACLQLFYVLLFIRLRLPGEFADLSLHGFPQTRLKPLALPEAAQASA
jgi:hypothetical protein